MSLRKSASRRVPAIAAFLILLVVPSRAGVIDVRAADPSPMNAVGGVVFNQTIAGVASSEGVFAFPNRRTFAASAMAGGNGEAYVLVGLGGRDLAAHNAELAADVLRTARMVDARARLLPLAAALQEEPLARNWRAHAVLAVLPGRRDEIVNILGAVIPTAAIEAMLRALEGASEPPADPQLERSAAFFDGAPKDRDLEEGSRHLGRLIAALKARQQADPYSELNLRRAPAAIYVGLSPFTDALQAIEADEGAPRDDRRIAGLRRAIVGGYLALQAAPDPAAAAALRVALWRRPGSPIPPAVANSQNLASRVFKSWVDSLQRAVDAVARALESQEGIVWKEHPFYWTGANGQAPGRFAAAELIPSPAWSVDGAWAEEAAKIWPLLGLAGVSEFDWKGTSQFERMLSRADAVLKNRGDARLDGFGPIFDVFTALRLPRESAPGGFQPERFVTHAVDMLESYLDGNFSPPMTRLIIEASLV